MNSETNLEQSENTQQEQQLINDDGIDAIEQLEPTETDVHDDIIGFTAPANKKAPYTPDEMRALDWQAIDTSRIPSEMQPFYKAMQASYTKKRQAEANELKNRPSQPHNTQQPNVQAYKMAHDKATQHMAQTMPHIAPTDPNYNAIASKLTADIVEAEQKRNSFSHAMQQELHNAMSEYGDSFQAVDKLASEILKEYPASMVEKMRQAVQNGDTSLLHALHRQAHERLVKQSKRATPPTTVSAGNTGGNAKDDTKSLFGY